MKDEKRKTLRLRRQLRASQDRKAGRSAFRDRWRDRYNTGTVTAMRAIYEGHAPHATEEMRRSVAKHIASIREEDPDTAERLFGPVQPSERIVDAIREAFPPNTPVNVEQIVGDNARRASGGEITHKPDPPDSIRVKL